MLDNDPDRIVISSVLLDFPLLHRLLVVLLHRRCGADEENASTTTRVLISAHDVSNTDNTTNFSILP